MRRSSGALIGALLLLSLVALALAPAGLGFPSARASSLTTVPAVRSDAVADAYGVGVHMGVGSTPYADATKVAGALANLGVRHVRDDLHLGAPKEYAAIKTVAARGIKFDLVMGRPGGSSTPTDYVKTLAAQLPAGSVESLEGVNEWDFFSGGASSWPTALLKWQKALYAAAKGNPA